MSLFRLLSVLAIGECLTLESEEQACENREIDAMLEVPMNTMLLQTGLQTRKDTDASIQPPPDGEMPGEANPLTALGPLAYQLSDCTIDDVVDFPTFKERQTEIGARPLTPPQVFGSTPGNVKKVYYINLDKSTDRRDFMESQLNKTSVPYKRFPAVPGPEIFESGEYDRLLNNRTICPEMIVPSGNLDTKPTRNGLGDLFSHILIYEEILQEDNSSDDVYLVLEDDAILPDGWQHKLPEQLAKLPPDWTAANLGIFHFWPRCHDIVDDVSVLMTHPAETPTLGGQHVPAYLGSAALAVTPRRLHGLVEEFSRQELCHVDYQHLSSGAIRTYAFWPEFTGINHKAESVRVGNGT